MPTSDLMCVPLELQREVPLMLPFEKKGLYFPEEFAETYLADPELRLEPGLYRFFALAGGDLSGSCTDEASRSIGGTASIVIEVR